MAKSNLLNTRTTNFLELVGNGRTYRVPAYQRDYSWEEEQWEDLLMDTLELRKNSDASHYMGALVVEAKSDRDFLIIDGQQRLATLSLFALAVIKKLLDLAEAGNDSAANRERAGGLRNRFVGEKNPASLIESSKLSLNQTDDAFYQDYLVQLRPPLNPRGLEYSNQQLWKCFQYFRKEIDKISEIKDDGEKLAELLAEAVGRQLMFILITVDDELNAYTVFETLNARGLELSTTDLLKNYLFSRVRVPSDLEALQRRWQALIATIGHPRFPEFLRYHLLCEVPKVRTQRLFKIVRDRIKSAPEVFELLDQLEGRAELFAALSDPNHGYWVDLAEAKNFVRELVLFRVKQMTPLLFATWEQFTPDQFVSVLRMVSVFSFRYSIISGKNTNQLEPEYHYAARAVLEKNARSPKEIFTKLKSAIYVEDEVFLQNFARAVIRTNGQRKKLAKYMLSRFESYISNREVDPDTDPGTIEHILPQNPTSEWESSFAREHWEANIYRLGNLSLLSPAANRSVGNAEYHKKKGFYESSGYQITQQIPVLAPEEWTPGHLEQRQLEMARLAVQIWRLDY